MATCDVVTTILLVFLLIAVVGLIFAILYAAPQLAVAVDRAVVVINQGIVGIGDVATSVFNQVQGLLSNAFEFVSDVAESIAITITTGINTAITAVTDLGTFIFDTLVSVFNDVRRVVLTIVDNLTAFFETVIQPVLDVILRIFNEVRNFVTLITCFLARLICCTLGAGCRPPSVLNCCRCPGSAGGECPTGQTCDVTTGQCVPI